RPQRLERGLRCGRPRSRRQVAVGPTLAGPCTTRTGRSPEPPEEDSVRIGSSRPSPAPRRMPALALALALLATSSCRHSGSSCTQCGRIECTNLAFSIHLHDGESVETCCPRCGLHYIHAEHPQVASLTARDFDSK